MAQGSVICVISGQGGKEVTFYVPDRIIQNINSGDAVTVTCTPTDKTFTVTVFGGRSAKLGGGVTEVTL